MIKLRLNVQIEILFSRLIQGIFSPIIMVDKEKEKLKPGNLLM